MRIIRNETPYLGSIKLKFEKCPYYVNGGTNGSMLNKVHLDLGFTKIVSRFYPDRSIKGKALDAKKLALINKYTGGSIKRFEWWNMKGGETLYSKPDNDNDVLHYGCLDNYFVSPCGKGLGDAREGWRYYKKNMLVCWDYPHGVAIVLKEPAKDYKHLDSYKTDGVVGGDDIKGYYGFTHRGGTTFKIGDRLFEEGYKPVEEDYDKNQWDKWSKDYKSKYEKGDDFDRDMIYDSISSVIPYRMRGSKIIETWEEAKQAAINMSSYLS